MKVRKLFTLLFIIIGIMQLNAASVQKPKIMIFPADDWCVLNGYMKDDTNSPDYEEALQNPEMDGAIAVMGDIMAEMGYEMFSLKQELKNINTENLLSQVAISKGGGMVIESERDAITRNVGVDFIVELSLNNKPFGLKNMIEFKAQTIDAASKKILHGDIGTSSASSVPIPVLIKEAVGCFIENFCHKIDLAFTNMETKGREGSISIYMAQDSPLNFDSIVTIDGESGELADYITYWLEEHTVNNVCSLTHKSPESLRFDQVYFPLVGQVSQGGFGSKKGRVKSLTMEGFFSTISKDLSRLGLSMTTIPIGQGAVYVVLGSK